MNEYIVYHTNQAYPEYLVDYTLVPVLFPTLYGTGVNGSICDDTVNDPGPWQLVRSPGCIGVKLVLFVLGVIGMWSTRSLYGATQVHTAQFARFQ